MRRQFDCLELHVLLLTVAFSAFDFLIAMHVRTVPIFTATTIEMNYKQNSLRRSGSTPLFLFPKCDPVLLDSLENPIKRFKPVAGMTNTFGTTIA